VLVAFATDFETASRISLAIGANTLRVLGPEGTRVRDLPRLTGVSKEANAMCAGWLERDDCVVSGPDPLTGRGKVLRLTEKGGRAQRAHRRHLVATEQSWRSQFGAGAIADLRAALERLDGDGSLDSSPLAAGLTPYPDNWRARTPRPATLPHYPMVLHRGGYPDGS
jgi:DNA-binding MarR family transcriptional regulator